MLNDFKEDKMIVFEAEIKISYNKISVIRLLGYTHFLCLLLFTFQFVVLELFTYVYYLCSCIVYFNLVCFIYLFIHIC